ILRRAGRRRCIYSSRVCPSLVTPSSNLPWTCGRTRGYRRTLQCSTSSADRFPGLCATTSKPVSSGVPGRVRSSSTTLTERWPPTTQLPCCPRGSEHQRTRPAHVNTVGHVATWVIAALRNQTFTTLGELGEAITTQVAAYNREPFQKRARSRASIFQAEEHSLLRPLPAAEYEISEWVYGRRVARNGHITWARNYYSVPYTQIGEKVDVRITSRMVEIYRHHERLSSHARPAPGVVNSYATNEVDLPPGPGYQEWDAPRVRAWAGRVGPCAQMVVDRIFESVPVLEQGLDPALAVLRLSQR